MFTTGHRSWDGPRPVHLLAVNFSSRSHKLTRTFPNRNTQTTNAMTDSATTDAIRMPLTSADVLGEREERLKELFPEAFVEGQIDFDRLRNALGDFVGEGRERYGLSWAGKAGAIR